jgi:hypothetical protein
LKEISAWERRRCSERGRLVWWRCLVVAPPFGNLFSKTNQLEFLMILAFKILFFSKGDAVFFKNI